MGVKSSEHNDCVDGQLTLMLLARKYQFVDIDFAIFSLHSQINKQCSASKVVASAELVR